MTLPMFRDWLVYQRNDLEIKNAHVDPAVVDEMLLAYNNVIFIIDQGAGPGEVEDHCNMNGIKYLGPEVE